MPQEPTKLELLELDIDTRLADAWTGALCIGEGEWTLDMVAVFMRECYAKGYADALTEERPGQLCRDHRDLRS